MLITLKQLHSFLNKPGTRSQSVWVV